jgi:hypothetical protein
MPASAAQPPPASAAQPPPAPAAAAAPPAVAKPVRAAKAKAAEVDATTTGAPAQHEKAPPSPAPVASAGAEADEAAPPSAVPTPPTGDLAVLRDRWPEIVARISAHPPTKPLIVVCRPISVEDGIVTLGFPEDKSFLRAVAERRRTVLEENISAVLGRSVGVRCVATNIDVVPDLPSDEEAAWILAEARRIFGEEGADPAEVG